MIFTAPRSFVLECQEPLTLAMRVAVVGDAEVAVQFVMRDSEGREVFVSERCVAASDTELAITITPGGLPAG